MTVTRPVIIRRAAALAALAAMLMGPAAYADSGFFIGVSIGDAGISIEDSDPDFDFDDGDTSGKVFAGYIFDLPVVDFGIEAGYVDFGKPSDTVDGEDTELDANGISAFGTIGVDWGVFGIFAKAGMVSWDVDQLVDNVKVFSDDGSDPAYGAGLRFNFSSVEIRAEYEVFDIADTDTVDMTSLGILWRF